MTNLNSKLCSLKLLSLSVRGLGNFRKRRAIYTWCRKQKADLIFLQETLSAKTTESQWKKEWGSQFLFSHDSANARGVAVLIRKGLDIGFEHKLRDTNGRMLLLKILINDKKYFLVNVYGPNKDAEATKYFQYLSTTLRAMDFESEDNVIIGGDFNCPLDPAKDKMGQILIPHQHLINSIENIQSEFNLHDIWHVENPTALSFTWSKTSPFIFCRLDYWLISDSLHDLVTRVDIIASIKTDHSAIVLELKEIEENCKGPGFWKLNTSLLANPEYVKTITSELPTWVKEANDLSNNRIKWDWLKFKIKMSSIAFSKKCPKSVGSWKRNSILNTKMH